MSKPRKSSLSRWLLASLVSALLVLFSLSASAGTVQIRDSGGVLSSSDVTALRNDGAAYPFDVRVVTTSEFDKRGDFDRYVAAQVGGPNMLVVGLDREHRYTSVHFGSGLGVPASEYRAIEQAGNSQFRDGNWRAGIDAILGQTKQFAHANSAGGSRSESAAAATPSRSLAGSSVFIGLVVVLVVAAAVVFVGSVLSRRAREGGFGSQAGYPPNMPPGPYPPGGGSYPPSSYGPGYGGGSGMGRNIVSAGLGGLVGYELGKMAGEHEGERFHEREHEAGMQRDRDEREDFDAGGSSGGWDDDSGGGDWGGGGGDDGGGGGSDW